MNSSIDSGVAVPVPGSASQNLAWRVLAMLGGYRMLAGSFLIVLFMLLRDPHLVGWYQPPVFLLSSGAWFVLGIVSLYLVRLESPPPEIHAYATLAVDILVVCLMLYASGGIQSGLGSLLVLSIGAGALIMSRQAATLFAAIAAIAVLVQQTLSHLYGLTTASEYTPAGLLGAIVFGIALAAQPLARRLRESEALARQRSVDLANLAQLNEYIIQHLREAILVVDSDDRIRLINESAINLLGLRGDVTGKRLEAIAERLWSLTSTWRDSGARFAVDGQTFIGADGTTVLTPQFAPIGAAGQGRPAALLIFLENTSELAERVQQTKLAALGRLSASIAHEIRNPVGAISHAGQLLGESETLGAPERRLTEIIHNHTGRVNKIIENVLELSRRGTTQPSELVLADWLDGFVHEFTTTMRLERDTLAIDCPDPTMPVRFDTSHLSQVLWNLCENAVRYAAGDGQTPIARLRCGRMSTNNRPFLEVLDHGPGIEEDSRVRIFEPFFTEASDGTGLGLYIAREMAQCNGAALVYQPRDGGGSCFRLIFADPDRWTV